jgi:hypothetical protein
VKWDLVSVRRYGDKGVVDLDQHERN